MKTEPFSVCSITSGKACFRCRASNLTPQHNSLGRVAKEKYGKCGIVGHIARFCGEIRPRIQWAQNKSNQNAAQRNNYTEDGDSSIGSYVEATDTIVLTIESIGEAPFVMEGKMNIIELTARINSGWPVTVFTTEDLKQFLCTNVLFARPLPLSVGNR